MIGSSQWRFDQFPEKPCCIAQCVVQYLFSIYVSIYIPISHISKVGSVVISALYYYIAITHLWNILLCCLFLHDIIVLPLLVYCLSVVIKL